MKKYRNWKVSVLSFGLAAACLCGGVLAAGDEKDPLISLSYLTRTTIPEILEEVEELAEEYQTKLLKDFNQAIDQYKGEMRQEQKENAKSATYIPVTLAGGDRLELDVGGEVLLRQGTVSVSASEPSALADLSGGDVLGDGGSLETNHLYMSLSKCVIVPESGAVTVLVRGSHKLL